MPFFFVLLCALRADRLIQIGLPQKNCASNLGRQRVSQRAAWCTPETGRTPPRSLPPGPKNRKESPRSIVSDRGLALLERARTNEVN